MMDILRRKKGQRGETKKKGKRAMNARKVRRKARDLDPPPSFSLV